jgi:hypothetical protein
MNPETGIKSIKLYTQDNTEVLQVYSMRREGDRLVMDCKVLDAMRMDVMLPAREALSNLTMLAKGLLPYILLLPYFAVRDRLRHKAFI